MGLHDDSINYGGYIVQCLDSIIRVQIKVQIKETSDHTDTKENFPSLLFCKYYVNWGKYIGPLIVVV